MSESIWGLTDALGPEKIIHIHHLATGLRAILVADNVACGPSIGGCRMAPEFCDVALEGARVVIEGFGSVGRHVARLLSAEGIRLVAVADSRGLVRNDDGLDMESLSAHKATGRPVREFPGGRPGELTELLDVP